jgi:hypothetical protein
MRKGFHILQQAFLVIYKIPVPGTVVGNFYQELISDRIKVPLQSSFGNQYIVLLQGSVNLKKRTVRFFVQLFQYELVAAVLEVF